MNSVAGYALSNYDYATADLFYVHHTNPPTVLQKRKKKEKKTPQKIMIIN